MSYDIYFVRRDPGQSFEDALDELENSFEDDLGELTDADLEHWEALLPRAQEIVGDVDVEEADESRRELTARVTGIELTLVNGEIEIHVPRVPDGVDELDLMATVYELARSVEDVTGLEGYDPQVGEPISDAVGSDTPTRRRWPDYDEVDDDAGDRPAGRSGTTARGAAGPVGDPRPEMAPDRSSARRHWWEFWRS